MALACVATTGAEGVIPGIDKRGKAVPACCLLPLGLVRLLPLFASLRSEPRGIGYCVMPGNAHNGIVALVQLGLPVTRLGVPSTNETGILCYCDGEAGKLAVR